MSGLVLVEMEDVSKRYLLGQARGVRGVLLDLLGQRDRRADHWALRDLSLSLARGESIGLVGRNGAGKTTALRLVAGISKATRGRVRTYGRVASLLNVGAGFHPELSGRENVLLNGVILGLSRKEARARYDAIVDFAGLDDAFMETPVKHYSSGMYARLAFSVAVHVEPDVLLIDEVLSVGDASFQDRSLRRMLEFRDRGQAGIVFVSHNLAAVELMCQRAIWLERGQVCAQGATHDVLRAYLDAVDDIDDGAGDARLQVDSVVVLDADGRPTETLMGDAPFRVKVSGRATDELAEPVFVVTIRGDHGPLFAGNMHIDGNWPATLAAGPFWVECAFDAPGLAPGAYRVELKVKQNVRTNYYEPRVMAHFIVPVAASAAGSNVTGKASGGGSASADRASAGGAAVRGEASAGGADVPYAVAGVSSADGSDDPGVASTGGSASADKASAGGAAVRGVASAGGTDFPYAVTGEPNSGGSIDPRVVSPGGANDPGNASPGKAAARGKASAGGADVRYTVSGKASDGDSNDPGVAGAGGADVAYTIIGGG